MLVTGGADFIEREKIKQWLNNPSFTFVKGDLLNPAALKKLKQKHFDLVFHSAANPEAIIGSANPNIHL